MARGKKITPLPAGSLDPYQPGAWAYIVHTFPTGGGEHRRWVQRLARVRIMKRLKHIIEVEYLYLQRGGLPAKARFRTVDLKMVRAPEKCLVTQPLKDHEIQWESWEPETRERRRMQEEEREAKRQREAWRIAYRGVDLFESVHLRTPDAQTVVLKAMTAGSGDIDALLRIIEAGLSNDGIDLIDETKALKPQP